MITLITAECNSANVWKSHIVTIQLMLPVGYCMQRYQFELLLFVVFSSTSVDNQLLFELKCTFMKRVSKALQ